MAYRFGLVVGISLVFASIVVATACSSSSSSTDSTAPLPVQGDAAESDVLVIVNTNLCKDTGNYEQCRTCCQPPAGYAVAQQAFITCMCQGACAAPCADSACISDPDASANPQSAACSQCLDSDPSATNCSATAGNICNADANCTRFTQCVTDACNGLPDSDAGH